MRLMSLALLVVLVGCASTTHVVVGEKRPAIKPELVKLYRSPPPKYEEIALIEGNSSTSMAITDQGDVDHVIGEMKKEAAKLGANGLLVEQVYKDAVLGRIGKGTAIYVPPQ